MVAGANSSGVCECGQGWIECIIVIVISHGRTTLTLPPLMPISFILQVIIASATCLHEAWSCVVNFKDLIYSAVWVKKDFV